jgi:hypothetical protein
MGRCHTLKDGGGECDINNRRSGVDERHKTLVSVSIKVTSLSASLALSLKVHPFGKPYSRSIWSIPNLNLIHHTAPNLLQTHLTLTAHKHSPTPSSRQISRTLPSTPPRKPQSHTAQTIPKPALSSSSVLASYLQYSVTTIPPPPQHRYLYSPKSMEGFSTTLYFSRICNV